MIIGLTSGSRLSIALSVDGTGTQGPHKGKWRRVRLNTRTPSNLTINEKGNNMIQSWIESLQEKYGQSLDVRMHLWWSKMRVAWVWTTVISVGDNRYVATAYTQEGAIREAMDKITHVPPSNLTKRVRVYHSYPL